MSDAERDRLIRETHANMAVVVSHTNDLRDAVFGANGSAGLKADVQRIDLQQQQCPARLSATEGHRFNVRSLKVAWAGVLVALAGVLVAILK